MFSWEIFKDFSKSFSKSITNSSRRLIRVPGSFHFHSCGIFHRCTITVVLRHLHKREIKRILRQFFCLSTKHKFVVTELKQKVFTHKRFSIEHYPIKGNIYSVCHTTGPSGTKFKVKLTFVSNQTGRIQINRKNWTSA